MHETICFCEIVQMSWHPHQPIWLKGNLKVSTDPLRGFVLAKDPIAVCLCFLPCYGLVAFTVVAELVRLDQQFWVIGPKGLTLPLDGWLELPFLHRMAMNHSQRVTGKDHYMQGELQLVLERWQLLDASRDIFSPKTSGSSKPETSGPKTPGWRWRRRRWRRKRPGRSSSILGRPDSLRRLLYQG